jgi:hypothetical protein
VGELVGQKMLVAFVGDRDYPAAVKHAKQINELYPGTRFHDYAKGLAEQLPKRMDDFTKLKLPTPAEWAELKKKLTRDQQIDYLCERMRLLNCFQMGQPGGYDPGERQYAEPRGLSENAAWGGGRAVKTEVINPLTELDGPLNWFPDDKPRPRGLNLTLKDVPRLSKYLRDDWYMLIVGFWRDFHPDRDLGHTRPLFASIINGMAHKDICRIRGWEGLTPAAIDKEIERIDKWAAENAGKTPEQLALDALEEALAEGENRYRIEDRVEGLLKAKETRVYDVLKRVLERDGTDAWTRGKILDLYRKHDANRAKDLAPKYLTDKDESLRLAAALIVFKTGDKPKARQILGDVVATGSLWSEAAGALLEDGTQESREQLARLFTNRNMKTDRFGFRSAVLARCAKAGMKEPYRFYAKMLDAEDDQDWVRDIVVGFARDDPAIKDIVEKYPERKDQIPHLNTWLRSKLDRKD